MNFVLLSVLLVLMGTVTIDASDGGLKMIEIMDKRRRRLCIQNVDGERRIINADELDMKPSDQDLLRHRGRGGNKEQPPKKTKK